VNRLLAFAAAMAAAACSPSSSRTSPVVDVDAACIPDGGVYACLDGTWTVCPASAKPSEPCDHTLTDCMGCAVGLGYTCTCEDSGLAFGEGGVEETVDASVWFCVGTEATCQ